MKIAELLDEVKAKTGTKSDGELARTLGIDKRRVSDYYTGHRAPDEYVCLKIAETLGKPLDTVIATVKASSEKDEKRREAWENYMKRLGGVAASFLITICVTVTMAVTSTPVEARPFYVSSPDHFVLCKQRWRLKLKSVLRRIRQKCTFRVNIAWIGQMAT